MPSQISAGPNKPLKIEPWDSVLAVFQGYWIVLSAGFKVKDLPSVLDRKSYQSAFQGALDIDILGYINDKKVQNFRKRFAHLLVTTQRINPIQVILMHQFLQGADLRGAFLLGTDLRVANLRVADLFGADLYGAYLSGAYLLRAYLLRADLSGADLRGADLHGADLRGADLDKTDFREARNLESIRNLTQAKHLHLANFKGTIYEGKFKKPEEDPKEE